MKAIHTGLVALLVSSTIALNSCNQGGGLTNTQIDPMPPLENMISVVAPSAPQTSNKHYSFQHKPEDFGFEKDVYDADFSVVKFKDVYSSTTASMKIVCTKEKDDLQEMYADYVNSEGGDLSNLILSRKRSVLGVEIKGRGQENILVDNKPALRGGGEFWTYMDSSRKEYGEKYTLLTTLVQGPKHTYKFTMLYFQDGTVNEKQADDFYDNVLETFHVK